VVTPTPPTPPTPASGTPTTWAGAFYRAACAAGIVVLAAMSGSPEATLSGIAALTALAGIERWRRS